MHLNQNAPYHRFGRNVKRPRTPLSTPQSTASRLLIATWIAGLSVHCSLRCVFSVHNNIVVYVFKTISDYKYDISDRNYDSASVKTAAERLSGNFDVPPAFTVFAG